MGCRVQVDRVSGFGCRVKGVEFRAQGIGFEV